MLPDDDDWTEICRSCFNVNFNNRGADNSLARPTSRCILFDGENTSFDVVLLHVYI